MTTYPPADTAGYQEIIFTLEKEETRLTRTFPRKPFVPSGKEEMKYEQAVRELEEIVERMENDELDIDQLSEQLKRAKTLVKLCKDKLTKTDEEIKKLLSED